MSETAIEELYPIENLYLPQLTNIGDRWPRTSIIIQYNLCSFFRMEIAPEKNIRNKKNSDTTHVFLFQIGKTQTFQHSNWKKDDFITKCQDYNIF